MADESSLIDVTKLTQEQLKLFLAYMLERGEVKFNHLVANNAGGEVKLSNWKDEASYKSLRETAAILSRQSNAEATLLSQFQDSGEDEIRSMPRAFSAYANRATGKLILFCIKFKKLGVAPDDIQPEARYELEIVSRSYHKSSVGEGEDVKLEYKLIKEEVITPYSMLEAHLRDFMSKEVPEKPPVNPAPDRKWTAPLPANDTLPPDLLEEEASPRIPVKKTLTASSVPQVNKVGLVGGLFTAISSLATLAVAALALFAVRSNNKAVDDLRSENSLLRQDLHTLSSNHGNGVENLVSQIKEIAKAAHEGDVASQKAIDSLLGKVDALASKLEVLGQKVADERVNNAASSIVANISESIAKAAESGVAAIDPTGDLTKAERDDRLNALAEILRNLPQNQQFRMAIEEMIKGALKNASSAPNK